MNPNRDYNKTRLFGPFVLQILQDSQHDGIAVDLFPRISVGINNSSCVVAIGFAWLTGDVNIGWAKQSYRDAQKHRREVLEKEAAKLGITLRQQELRWGW